jgi:mannose-6-phosphate isomerase-like protein (cupin superfamily)
MRYLRSVDFGAYDPDRYGAQFLYNGESAIVIGSNVPAGAAAPAQHVHPVDQLYFVLSGVMHVQLGAEVHVVTADTLVYIPAGTPHHNWNEGDEDEFHFEVLAPMPPRRVALLAPTEETDLGGRTPRIVSLGACAVRRSTAPGFAVQRVLAREDGSEHMSLSVATVEPGAGGPATHVHTFDQFYYVLEGSLAVEVGLERAIAGPHSLVVLPAGVAHSHRNEGPGVERHISVIAPEPPPGHQPWDVAVALTRR